MLKIWLPLDGDLRNLGTSDKNFSIKTDLTYVNNGKIGKAYSGGAITMDAATTASILNNQEFSFTCWVYINSAAGDTSNRQMFFGTEGMGANNNRKFSIFQYPTCNDLHISWMNDAASTTFCSGVWSGVFPSYKWTHVAITYKNPNCVIYINGIKYATCSGVSNSSSFEYETYLFKNAPNQTRYLNDYRIYNHCLSAAEVHEIAMGLVLHYKLDLPNKNFCIGTNTSDINTNKWSLSMQTGGSTKEIIYDNNIPCVKITRDNTAQSGWRYFQYANLNVSALTPNTTYTISFDMKTSVDGTVNIVGFYNGNATNLITTSAINVKSQLIANQWNHVILRVTTIDSITVSSQVVYMSLSSSLYGTGVWMIMKNMKVEVGEKDTPWSPHPNDELFKILGLDTSIVTDSSGYGHNGIINGNPTITTDTLRYYTNMNFHSASVDYITIPSLKLDMTNITFSVWAKWTAFNSWSRIFDFGETTSGAGYSILVANSGNNLYVGGRRAGGASLPDTSIMSLTTNTWYYITVTIIDTICKTYVNGTLVKTFTLNGNIGYVNFNLNYLGKSNWSNDKMLDGYISDFRIYCTPLLDNDIKMLYNISMKVDNLGEVHTFEFDENQSNLMWRPENARAAGLGMNYNEGLGSYTQSNCQVTCDSNGYRIYRPPNLTVANNGNTMWGGLKVRNSTDGNVHIYDATKDNIFGLIKGHTYIFIISVKGKSSNSTAMGITNNMGWGGGGLGPSPTNVVANSLGENFNGEKEIFYKFTINDDVVKTCTTSYSSFVQNNKYLSYMDFTFGYGYTNTETLGTDLYISNISLYDITNTNIKLNKDGILNLSALLENRNTAKIYQSGIIESTEFIEL